MTDKAFARWFDSLTHLKQGDAEAWVVHEPWEFTYPEILDGWIEACFAIGDGLYEEEYEPEEAEQLIDDAWRRNADHFARVTGAEPRRPDLLLFESKSAHNPFWDYQPGYSPPRREWRCWTFSDELAVVTFHGDEDAKYFIGFVRRTQLALSLDLLVAQGEGQYYLRMTDCDVCGLSWIDQDLYAEGVISVYGSAENDDELVVCQRCADSSADVCQSCARMLLRIDRSSGTANFVSGRPDDDGLCVRCANALGGSQTPAGDEVAGEGRDQSALDEEDLRERVRELLSKLRSSMAAARAQADVSSDLSDTQLPRQGLTDL